MPTYGALEPFHGEGAAWTEYLERAKIFFDANNVPDAKKRSVFLTCCGPATYSLLRSLLTPKTPDEVPIDEIFTVLSSHYVPKPSVVVSRFKFNSRTRQPGEAVSDYIAALKKLSSECEYGTFLPDMLRDRLVCGIADATMQRRLLEEVNLTFDSAVKLLVAMETAKNDSSMLMRKPSMEETQEIHVVKSTPGQRQITCYRCGDAHYATACKHAKARCGACGKVGHLAKVCRSKKALDAESKSHLNKGFKKRGHPVNAVGSVEIPSPCRTPTYETWSVESSGTVPPFFAILEVAGKSLRMELDTGASVSIMGEKAFHGRFPELTIEPSDVVLRSYCGKVTPVKGKVTVPVQFGTRQATLPLFLAPDQCPTLLGRNWISALDLDLTEVQSIKSLSSVDELLSRYKSVFSEGPGTLKGVKAKLFVKEGAVPKFFKPRTIPFALQDRVAEKLEKMQREQVLVPVRTSEWAAPIVPVAKEDGSIRVCGDFKLTINPVAVLEKYPVPRVEDLWAKLSGGQRFTRLDLKDAYQQVELDEESQKLCTINTPQGLFKYTRLPFGVSSAPAIFQREMENLLQALPQVAVYFDDIIVTGKNDAEHFTNVNRVLQRLQDAGLKLKLEKCTFLANEVEYLGHVIDAEGLRPTPKKVEAVLKAPSPRDVRQLQSYLGLINFYRRFLPDLSSVLRPLYLLLVKDARWKWTAKEEEAFNKSKELLTSAPVLQHFDPTKPIVLSCDASPYGVGAVLAQRDETGEHPVAFASRSLLPAEQKYSQLDKEALAIIFGITKFHQYLWGHDFEVVTDHKPLLGLLGQDKPIPERSSPRMIRWAITLSAYRYQLIYRPGACISNADALSRLPLPAQRTYVPQPSDIFMLEGSYPRLLSPSTISTATLRDPILSRLLRALMTGDEIPQGKEWSLFQKCQTEFSIHENCVLRGARVVIPESLQADVLSLLHETHPGVEKMKTVARSHVWWNGLDQDITDKVKHCQVCQENQRMGRRVQSTPWPFPKKPWSRLHVDFGGPFKSHYFFVLVDAFSKWVEVVPVTSPSAESTIKCLRKIFSTHGLPDTIVSDNGTAFTSDKYADFLARNGIRRILVPPYHPASNGAAERVVQTIKSKLKKAQPGDFQTSIDRILLSYRTTKHSLTGSTPSELLMGRKLQTALDRLHPSLRTDVEFKLLKQKLRCDENARRAPMPSPGEPVFARNFRPGPAWIPGTARNATSSSSVEVELRDGTVWNRHGDHVRPGIAPCIISDDEEPPQTTLEAAETGLTDAGDNLTPEPLFMPTPQPPSIVHQPSPSSQATGPDTKREPQEGSDRHLRRSRRRRKAASSYAQ